MVNIIARQQARRVLLKQFPDVCRQAFCDLIERVGPHPHDHVTGPAHQRVQTWAIPLFSLDTQSASPSYKWLIGGLLTRVWRHLVESPFRDEETGFHLLASGPAEYPKHKLLGMWGSLAKLTQHYPSLLSTDVDRLKANLDRLTLLPPGADPTTQSIEEYLKVAKRHYRARETELKRAGFASKHEAPSLDLHVKWFLRYQVNLESAASIAKGPPVVGGSSGARTVQLAVQRMAERLDLPLRKGHPKRTK